MKNYWLNDQPHIYTNGHEFVIATCVTQAKLVIMQMYGYEGKRFEDLDEFEQEDIEGDGWKQYPDDKDFTLYDDSGMNKTTQPAWKWATSHPKGHFASREW